MCIESVCAKAMLCRLDYAHRPFEFPRNMYMLVWKTYLARWRGLEYLEQMTHPGSANDLSKVDVHPVVTAYKMSIVRFPIFQFHQLERKGNIYKAWPKLKERR